MCLSSHAPPAGKRGAGGVGLFYGAVLRTCREKMGGRRGAVLWGRSVLRTCALLGATTPHATRSPLELCTTRVRPITALESSSSVKPTTPCGHGRLHTVASAAGDVASVYLCDGLWSGEERASARGHLCDGRDALRV